jgi:hypothetical protein
MTTFLFLSLIVVLVPSVAALLHAVHQAREGYEDEIQFHAGVCPRSVLVTASASARSSQNWVEGPRLARLPQLAVKDPANA